MNKARMKTLNDSLGKIGDGISFGQPWAETEILCGYGYHHSNDPFALSYLEEEIFEPLHNTVPVSGVQTLLELAFGVSGNITIPTLYTAHGIGLPDDPTVPTYLVPENSDTLGSATPRPAIYQPGHLVQLFGIGITGPGENNVSVRKVGYRETDIEMQVITKDGPLDGIMLPFRFTESELDPNERQKYFGKKVDSETGKTGYYLKRFEALPEIKHIWRSKDIQSGSHVSDVEATNDTIWDQTRDDALKSVVEMHIEISESDVKEYFTYKMDQPEAARFNTLALYTGRYSEAGKPADQQYGDYTNVRLFSKLAIPTEPVSLSKDLQFIYRIYGS